MKPLISFVIMRQFFYWSMKYVIFIFIAYSVTFRRAEDTRQTERLNASYIKLKCSLMNT
jgi:hypothetical protein